MVEQEGPVEAPENKLTSMTLLCGTRLAPPAR